MGVGAALDKIVVGYSSDQRSYVDKVGSTMKCIRGEDGQLRDAQGLTVEEFRDRNAGGLVDNLMISCGIEALCRSAEEAIVTAIKLYAERQQQ